MNNKAKKFVAFPHFVYKRIVKFNNNKKKKKLLKFIQIIKINFSVDAAYIYGIKCTLGYSYRFHVDFIKYEYSDQLENFK